MEGIDFALKKAIAEGMVIGPRMLVSGMAICMAGGHGRPLALDGEPLSNLNSLENVSWVMKEGKIVYRDYKDKGSS